MRPVITALATLVSASFVVAACSDSTGPGNEPTEDGGLSDTGPVDDDAVAPDAGADAKPMLPKGTTASFTILESTDIHTSVRSYDYFKLAEDKTFGLERTATLIKQARTEFPNSILVDNGDTIQGTVLSDYQAVISRVPCDKPLAVYKAMNSLGFDVGGIGNHEFNYGLGFLSQVTHTPFDVEGVDTAGSAACAGPQFKQVLSNVFSAKTNKPLFQPSTIVTKQVTVKKPDGTAEQVSLNVGFIAFTPPQIMNWDKRWLDEKVFTKGVQEVAPALVQDLRAKGADVVVAIIHGGLDDKAYDPGLENQGLYLARVPGIDALLLGHAHQVFPNAASTVPQFNLPGVDKDKGTVAGVPAVMANFWGQNLGVLDLALTYDGGWSVDRTKTIAEARPISTTCTGGKPVACDAQEKWRTGAACSFATMCTGKPDKTRVSVDVDATIAPLVQAEHDGTIAYVRTPIGNTDFDMTTFFTDVGDVSAIQIVNQAQAAYVADYIHQNLPQYESLPLISFSAPFKSGNQGGTDYTDVRSGSLAINNAADLYLYANTLYAVKVNGAELKDWLEMAATRFLRIDPAVTTPQPLINTAVASYNYDVLTDPRISYEIDVTQPLPPPGTKPSGRIKNLRWNGAPLSPTQEFVVATNNYRASGGGGFPGLDGSKTIYPSPDTNREILIAYIKKIGNLTRAANGSARSWRFTKVATAGRVTFTSAQNALPKAQAAGLTNISLVQQDDGTNRALSIYAVDLDQ